MKKLILITIALSTNIANAQWQQTGLSGKTVRCLASDGTNIFAGTPFDGAFLSTNNGGSWTAVNNGLTTANQIMSVAINGTNIFAGTTGGVFLSANNGTNWTAVNTGLTSIPVGPLAISGTNIFAGTNGGVFLSTNNGTNWTAVNSGLTANTMVRSFAISGTNIFAGTNGGGVFLSANNGTNWTAVNTGLTSISVGPLAISGTNIFAGTNGGVFLSTNNGTNWTAVNNGLTNLSVTSLAISGTNIFAGTYNGGVFLSTNNGSSWTAVNTGLTSSGQYVYSLTIVGTYIFATGANGVWKRLLSDFVTGIENNPASGRTHFIVYPNPTNGKFTVSNEGVAIERCEVEIYNVLGECIHQHISTPARSAGGSSNFQIDLSSQPNGVYFLKMQTDKVQEIQKLIIQK